MYDAIIVGGRPAGASVAIRLAKAGWKVLVLDRATFPSKPDVPSMPLLAPQTVRILEEIDLSEAVAQKSGQPLKRMILNMGGHFEAEIDFARALGDQTPNCFYSIRRDLFDNEVWQQLANYPSIEARSGVSVTSILRNDAGRVHGVTCKDQATDTTETHYADVIVGADGRFSFVAQQVKAQTTFEDTDVNTDFYFAYWKNLDFVQPDGEHTMHVYSNVAQMQVTIFPTVENMTAVGLQMATGKVSKASDETPETFYENQVNGFEFVKPQLANAERISQVWGLKKVGNGYRQVGGDGWVLTGDAVHYKDSIDAQGIYDAMLTSKLLAKALIAYKAGSLTWEQAIEQYGTEMKEATWDMFQETLGRLKREIYADTPPIVLKTVLRWVTEDPKYQQEFLALISRQIEPKGWATPQLMLGSMVRGLGRDVRGVFS